MISRIRYRVLSLFAVSAVLMGQAAISYGDDASAKKKEDAATKPGLERSHKSEIHTQVKREQIGEPLSEGDIEQVSILGAHLLHQIDRARKAIDANEQLAAESDIGKARKICDILLGMLPKAHVTTTVKDSGGNLLYEDEEVVQQTWIPVYRLLAEVDVTRPIVESKGKAARLKGEVFEGSDLVEADVVVNLGYLQRRLDEAAREIKSDSKAADLALAEAQTRGTELAVSESESPLDEAREALQLAHQAAIRKEYQAAQANLRIAHGFLALYRQIAPDEKKKEISELTKEMEQITKDIVTTSSNETHERQAGAIKRYLDKVTSWWAKKNVAARRSPAGVATTPGRPPAAAKPLPPAGSNRNK